MCKNKLLIITILVSMAGNSAIQTAERSYGARVPKDPALIILKNYLVQSNSLEEAVDNFSRFFNEFSTIQLSDQEARGILTFIKEKFPTAHDGIIHESTLLDQLLAKPLPNHIERAVEYRKKVSKFIDAVFSKRLDKVNNNIAQGMNINVKNADGYTPLAAASATFNTPLIELLLQRGADPNGITNDNSSPLTIIFSDHCFENDSARIKIAELLLNAGADINHQGYLNKTALFIAIPSTKDVQVLLQKGANPNIADDKGVTPLMHAAGLKNYENVESLLKARANPMLKDHQGRTALNHIDDECKSMESYLPRNAQGYEPGYVEGLYQNCDRIHNLIQSHMKQQTSL